MERERSEYPTESEMRESWDAVESGDHKSLVEILRKRREQVEADAPSKATVTRKHEAAARESLHSDYPTDHQIDRLFDIHKKGGEEGILEFLKQQRAQREAEEGAEKAQDGNQLGKEDALRAYAVMMNTLDASKFLPLLADDFRYTSQWVFKDIESKREFFDYITGKLQTVKNTGTGVWAEMGESGHGDPCVLMAQGEKDKVAAVVLTEVKEGRIKRIDICMPELFSATRSGDYPKQQRKARARQAAKLMPAPQELPKPASVVSVTVEQLNSLLEKNAQLEEEKRSSFGHQINESLHNPGDRLAWCIVFFVISIALTLPFMPGGAAFFLSVMVAGGSAIVIGRPEH